MIFRNMLFITLKESMTPYLGLNYAYLVNNETNVRSSRHLEDVRLDVQARAAAFKGKYLAYNIFYKAKLFLFTIWLILGRILNVKSAFTVKVVIVYMQFKTK